MTDKCQKCQSPQPHLHPAMNHGGEVELCTDDYHLTQTPSNTPELIAMVVEKRQKTNGGIWCDVKKGHCACGAYH